MENQHQKITGYRELSQAEIDLMNEIKAHGEQTRILLDKVNAHVGAQFKATEPTYGDVPFDEIENPFIEAPCIDTPEQTAAKSAERSRLVRTEPFRWQAIAKTDFQTGLMALTRAVAQPTSF